MPSSTTTTTTAIWTSTTLTSSQIISILENGYPDLTTTTFSLTHSIYRSTSKPSSQPATAHLQILSLSSQPKRTFLCTSTSAPDMDKVAVVAIPTASDPDFRRLLRDKLGTLWQAMKAGEMRATGSEIEIGVFRVVVVDLVRDRGLTGGGVEHRGALISISVNDEGGFNEESSAATAGDKTLVQEFCSEIGISQSGSEVWGNRSTMQGEVELWCSVLRQHAAGSANTRPPATAQ